PIVCRRIPDLFGVGSAGFVPSDDPLVEDAVLTRVTPVLIGHGGVFPFVYGGQALAQTFAIRLGGEPGDVVYRAFQDRLIRSRVAPAAEIMLVGEQARYLRSFPLRVRIHELQILF